MDKKKENELKFAKVFIDWLNKKNNFDYFVIPNEKENKKESWADVYAVSRSRKFEQLDLQLVTSDGHSLKNLAKSKKINKKTGQIAIVTTDLNSEERVKEMIYEKEQSYSQEVKQSIILLIQKEVGPEFNEEYFFKIFQDFNSDYKGIYLVHYQSKGICYPASSRQILPIKKLKINTIS